MSIHASAPGKLVLCGEYAVLEGAPSLVLAVDAQARVSLQDASDDAFRVAAPDVGANNARFERDAQGRVQWNDLDYARQERLRLVARIIDVFGANQTPFRASFDTSDFVLNGRKLGLGSSAALTVALAGALCARARREPPKVEELIALHREWQGGGSGVDVAASCNGGLCIYRLRNGEPTIERVRWPAALYWSCIWSGEPSSTGAQLRKLSDWRARAPQSYSDFMCILAHEAEAASAAARIDDAASLLHSIAAYAQRLRELDDAASLGIFGAAHRALTELAERHGVIYKPCGAGGDIGIALSPNEERLRGFLHEFESVGFRKVPLKRSDRGLQVFRDPFQSAQEEQDHAGRYLATAS